MKEKMEKRRKPIDQRLTFEVDGQSRRLSWIAENMPEFLIKELCAGDWGNQSAILSALAKEGWDRPKIEEEARLHPEWGADPGILEQV